MKEEKIHQIIEEGLEKHSLNPESVVFTFCIGEGVLAITFYIHEDLKELLELLSWSSQCDKRGYLILNDTNTIILSGIALINLYSVI